MSNGVIYDPSTRIAIAGLFLYSAVVFGLCINRVGVYALVAACLAMPVAQIGPALFLPATPHFLPGIFDQNIAQLDATLGMQPCVRLAVLLESIPGMRALCVVIYMLILTTLGVAIGYEIRSGAPMGIGLIPTAYVAGLLGAVIYCFVPAVGPAVYFGADYAHLLTNPSLIGGHDDFTQAPRNCIPSLHTSWALLAFWGTRGRSVFARVFTGVFLIFTLLACLGFGGHYLVDLVVAVPFMLLVRAVCSIHLSWRTARGSGALVGLTLVLAWCAAVRAGIWVAGPTVPLLMLGTVIVAVVFERRIAALESRHRTGRAQASQVAIGRFSGSSMEAPIR